MYMGAIWPTARISFHHYFYTPLSNTATKSLSYAGDIAGMRSTPVSMHTSSGAHTPASTTFINNQDAGPLNLNIHAESSPLAPAGDGTVQASAPTISQLTSVREKLSTMDSSKTLTDICTTLEIDWNTAVNPAHYIEVGPKQPQGLLVMVRNYWAMSQLLVQLGQPDHRDDPHGIHTLTYPGGLILSTRNILIKLGWTPTSYAHKSNWYQWAACAAVASWQRGVSG
jgi:hypothetical protein